MTDKVYLPSTFNQDECSNVFEDCKKTLETFDRLVVNGSVVERIGTAGMQVLISVGLLCEKMNKSCEIEMPSSSLLEAFEQLGCINIVKKLGMIS